MSLTTPANDAELAASTLEQPHEYLPLSTRIANIGGILIPFVGFIAVVITLWGRGFDWLHLSLFLGMYMISAIGITIGYHRYFTHRAFQTHRVVEAILAIFGSMAFEGPVLKWVANHRCHHKHSDRPGDPHSPHEHGEGVVNMLKGMWHAHVGWIFNPDPKNQAQYVPDLASDRLLRWISQSWTVWAALGLVLPAILGGLITLTWQGAVLGFLWGGLARVFLVHHVTWSVNSVCHIWGSRPYRSHDHSRNNFIFGVLALGEGWHNNHHAFPTSARHGLKWWQVDFSWWMIKAASWVGLVWDVKVPNEQKKALKEAGVVPTAAMVTGEAAAD